MEDSRKNRVGKGTSGRKRIERKGYLTIILFLSQLFLEFVFRVVMLDLMNVLSFQENLFGII